MTYGEPFMRTRYNYTIVCRECSDRFNTDDKDEELCEQCAHPLRIPIGQGSPHVCPHDDMTIHRVQRLLEDDATDSAHGDYLSEGGK